MKCPRCKRTLTDASIHLDTFEDDDKDLLQVLIMHSACGYLGFCMMSPTSFLEVPDTEFGPRTEPADQLALGFGG